MRQLAGSEDTANFSGSAFIGLDHLPPSIRMFVEQQSCAAGHCIGRSGSDYGHDHDGSMGEETGEQKRRRRRRYEDLWRAMMASAFYVKLYIHAVETLSTSKTILAIKRKKISREIEAITKIEEKIENSGHPEWAARAKSDLRERKETLEAQRTEIDRHEREVLAPIERVLNREEPPDIPTLRRAAEQATESAQTAHNPYYPPFYEEKRPDEEPAAQPKPPPEFPAGDAAVG